MRTVLQALSMYPRLLGLVLNILQRMIKKEVCLSPPHPVYENCTTGSVYVPPATGAGAQYTAEND